jgi:hypothetical protein
MRWNEFRGSVNGTGRKERGGRCVWEDGNHRRTKAVKDCGEGKDHTRLTTYGLVMNVFCLLIHG